MKSKRIFDLFLTLCVLPVALPLMAAVALAVWIGLGNPILFWQARPGLRGEIFKLAKFRTLRSLQPGEDMLSTDGARMTALGRILRKTGLDELPSLYNIIRGELSWVGPRPLLPEYLPLYSDRQKIRHKVLPGLTGWAQVNGRNDAPWEERLEMDAWYVEHQTLVLDLQILWLTFWVLLTGRGATTGQQATSEPFKGNS